MSRQAICPDCGWKSKPTRSDAMAEHAGRLHRCARTRRLQAAKLRRMRKRSKIDRTPKPCLHKIAQHEHGTHACYVLDACRCRPCAKANSAYENARSRRNAYGRSNYIDAQPARDHALALMAAGVGMKRIVIVSGVSSGVLWKLLYGKRKPDGTRTPSVRITKPTAQRILALDVRDLQLVADGAMIDSTGYARRVQGLVVLGWSVSQVSARSGVNRQCLDGIIRGRKITGANARAVVAVYEQLWKVAPPETNQQERQAASRARLYAAAAGWAPPLAWDDDAIDDPTAEPMHLVAEEPGSGIDEAAVERRLGGDKSVQLTRAERWVVVRRLHAQGLDDREIARLTGIWDRQVLRDRQSLSLPAVPQHTRGESQRDRFGRGLRQVAS